MDSISEWALNSIRKHLVTPIKTATVYLTALSLCRLQGVQPGNSDDCLSQVVCRVPASVLNARDGMAVCEPCAVVCHASSHLEDTVSQQLFTVFGS